MTGLKKSESVETAGATGEESAATRLESAAVALLSERGVLSGFTLRDVAARANVTRSLVYHYFTDSRDLLRSALRQRTLNRSVVERMVAARLPPQPHVSEFFAYTMKHVDAVRLMATLILDGDEGFESLPFSAETNEVFRRYVENAELPEAVAPATYQAGLTAAIFGWSIFKETFARELDEDPKVLDAEVMKLFMRMLEPPRPDDPSTTQ